MITFHALPCLQESAQYLADRRHCSRYFTARNERGHTWISGYRSLTLADPLVFLCPEHSVIYESSMLSWCWVHLLPSLAILGCSLFHGQNNMHGLDSESLTSKALKAKTLSLLILPISMFIDGWLFQVISSYESLVTLIQGFIVLWFIVDPDFCWDRENPHI